MSDKIKFQITEWDYYHEKKEHDVVNSENKTVTVSDDHYTICLFGRTDRREDKTVYVKVTDFTPFFYVAVPDEWQRKDMEKFVEDLKNAVSYKHKIKNYKLLERHSFRGFTNDKMFKFVMLIFENMWGFKAYEKVLLNPVLFVEMNPFMTSFIKNQIDKCDPDDKKAHSKAVKKLVTEIKKKKIPEEFHSCVVEQDVLYQKKKKYLRLFFDTMDSLKVWEEFLSDKKLKYLDDKNRYRRYQLYESNIEPLLRCMHMMELMACGWVEIDQYTEIDGASTSDINIETNFKNLKLAEYEGITNIKIGSFDIECTSEDGSFPQATRTNDKIIQIGTTYSRYGQDECYRKVLISLGECAPIEGTEVISCKTEKEVLLKWRDEIEKEDPDILTGWNIFGFDEKYINDRAEFLGCLDNFARLGRTRASEIMTSKFVEKKLASSAMGDNVLKYFKMIGRVQIDLMKTVQRSDEKLTCYKLDYVVSHFIKEEIENLDIKTGKITTGNTKGMHIGQYIAITYDDGVSVNSFREGRKFLVTDLTATEMTVTLDKKDREDLKQIINVKQKLSWCQAKDDIKPKEIFQLQKGSPEDRAKVGKYCIQDCALCNLLLNKLQILNNNVGMANVCSVPMSYLFLRGQGIKGTSLVAKYCRKKNYLIPVLEKPKEIPEEDRDKVGYEGATVLTPNPKVYFVPITVLDYSSLYPKSMISRNLSHETIILDEKYNNLKDYNYIEVLVNNKDGTKKTCRFAERKDGKKGIIPEILTELLEQREKYKNLMKKEPDKFKEKMLDGLQLAYKVTANSLYGIIGSLTSAISLVDISASTTATGRDHLMLAKQTVENAFPGSEIIYGDTDSIFIKFSILDDKGQPIEDKRALIESIKLGKQAADLINAKVKKPQKIVYEKTLWPFIILAKKKYVGNLYKEDPEHYDLKFMGIVLKRRDNAQIVKEVVGGIIHSVLNERSVDLAVKHVKRILLNILNRKYPLDKFVISKSLKSNYKKPETIAHKVLADRMKARDPGSAPMSGDRISYAFVRTKGKVKLQGERIEDIDYIKEKKLKLDYLYYITNQIMIPSIQFFELLIDKPERLFDVMIAREMNRQNGVKTIDKYLAKDETSDSPEPPKKKSPKPPKEKLVKPVREVKSITNWLKKPDNDEDTDIVWENESEPEVTIIPVKKKKSLIV